jgi:A/G-specific adenine glycosylase
VFPELNNKTVFSQKLLRWYYRHGRHELPWQGSADPYRIWVSEIMLQQTQVQMVIPYYERFMASFVDVQSLAAAPIDRVLDHWTGLGYYARARNLHHAAKIIVDGYGGSFPEEFDQVVSLPGVGPSTAGAILAFAFGQRQPILDGNVKRVLARYHLIAGYPGNAKVTRQLWALSEDATPHQDVAAYTQAIMDLGSMICTRRSPRCSDCPLAPHCAALASGDVERYPGPRPSRTRERRSTVMIMLRDTDGRVLLERRPARGVWGGLWSFPECPEGQSVSRFCRDRFGVAVTAGQPWKIVRHGFTHFELEICPQLVRLTGNGETEVQGTELVWYKPGTEPGRGLAAPVRRLLTRLEREA